MQTIVIIQSFYQLSRWKVSRSKNTLKGYIAYDSADINRNGLSNKETPQTIENIDIQKNRNYGTNDLSSILEGNAGIDAGYDMRGESIKIRGFSVDGGDIYIEMVLETQDR